MSDLLENTHDGYIFRRGLAEFCGYCGGTFIEVQGKNKRTAMFFRAVCKRCGSCTGEARDLTGLLEEWNAMQIPPDMRTIQEIVDEINKDLT